MVYDSLCQEKNQPEGEEKVEYSNNLNAQNIYEQPITLKTIARFALPTVAMTVFMSFYTMVDGLFVSNLIGWNTGFVGN